MRHFDIRHQLQILELFSNHYVFPLYHLLQLQRNTHEFSQQPDYVLYIHIANERSVYT